MSKVPFKVSARTARLIGRENVTNADGAVIELVKNTYDADAEKCIIYFNNKYNSPPKELSKSKYKEFNQETLNRKLIKRCYKRESDKYILKDLGDEVHSKLKKYFNRKNSIYIIDNGEGMTKETILNHWMTIGTNNKQNNYITEEKKRIKVGAKGIGRFALDRLGSKCEMITLSKETKQCYRWSVNWDEFEEKETSINEIKADLEGIEQYNIYEEISNLLNDFNQIEEILNKFLFSNGTIIKITDLRDDWNDYYVNKIYSNLEMLIPPNEEKDNKFDIYVLSSLKRGKYGKINSSVRDDFDYKLDAKVKKDGIVEIDIYRNEFNLQLIPKEFFNRNEIKEYPYNLDTFREGHYKIERSIKELLPGYKKNIEDIIEEIGEFKFKFYFMKRKYVRKKKKTYFYKNFNSSNRIEWLNKFGGIKIFRDNFRVRPYGEPDGTSFDWLMLGDRSSKSPAAPSHPSGSWRVSPNQVYGIVNISRVNNINFSDKSSREGLQENEEFMLLKELLIKIINIFEKDRQTIMRNMKKYYNEKYRDESNKKKAKSIAKKIVSKSESEDSEDTKKQLKDIKEEKNEEEILAKSILSYEQENQDLLTEMKLLRGLSSTGLVITSFAHELKNLSAPILSRTNDLKEVLREIIPAEKINELDDYMNPFIMIEDFKKQDKRLKFWLDFALNVVKKDGRKRKKHDLFDVFEEFKRNWESALLLQEVNLVIPERKNRKCLKRCFLIDIDSIFNNLISNSLDAFRKSNAGDKRKIDIKLYEKNNKLNILYEDTGPGLSGDIENPYEIFEPFFTTKRNEVGERIGTGLGMWIVQSSIEEYNGEIEILNPKEEGFKIKILLPLRKHEGVREV